MDTWQFTVLQDGLVGGGEKVLSSADLKSINYWYFGLEGGPLMGPDVAAFMQQYFIVHAAHEAMANQELLWKFLFCM